MPCTKPTATRGRRPWLRWALLLALVAGWAVACAPGFLPPSKVVTLRILAVTVDRPYALPGDDVTLRMTVSDGLGDPSDPAAGPRDLQILWLGGCFDPEGDQYYLCFDQLAETLAPLAESGDLSSEYLQVGVALASADGTPDAHEFTLTMPEDIVSRRPVPQAGPHYGIAYVFFAACAGQLAPAALQSTGGDVPDFPLQCLDADGQPLGSDSFVIGYTQIYAFADGRLNDNPAMDGLDLDGDPMAEELDQAPTVKACPVDEASRRTAACSKDDPTADCRTYTIKAEVARDVAEVDPDGQDADGNPLHEVVWISYFADGGDLDPSLALVNDATKGYQSAFETEWVPPAEPGVYSIWAVLRDQRGGSTVLRRFVRVE
jgi:hypothetical protein